MDNTNLTKVATRVFLETIICFFVIFSFVEIASAESSSEAVDLGSIVVTATKSDMKEKDVPGRVDVVSGKEMGNMPVENVDEALVYTPGINGRRANNMFSFRPVVTLRGLGGDEQGRTLVMMDGIPLNKADTGDVNWNMMLVGDVDQVEVFKGPGSSLYGNNAMGGVINVITKKPEKLFEEKIYAGYGSYNTWKSGFIFGARSREAEEDALYLRVSGQYQHSTGYVSDPDAAMTSYTTRRFIDEQGINTRIGYELDELNGVDLTYIYNRGKRGEGEKYRADDGVHRLFETNFVSMAYRGASGNVKWSAKAFYDREDYTRVSERMRGVSYQRFDVESKREDYGALGDIFWDICDWNTLSAGTELRIGSVDAADVYKTSPDIVENRGKMALYSVFLQDEARLFDDRFIFVAGIRYDWARFYDGYYNSTDPSWTSYNGDLSSNDWWHISPRVSARYIFADELSVYCSYSNGFRASILDDLCRSGWMWVGPKIANPDLEPETLDNYEVGADIMLADKVKIKPSFYYSIGKDFLYYVDSGQRLWGTRIMYKRENVGKVRSYGLELGGKADICENFSLLAGYTYQDSIIREFNQRPNLEGKTITYVPRNQAYAGMEIKTPYVNGMFFYRYKDKQFTDEENNNKIDPYYTVDLKLWKKVDARMTISLTIENLLNEKYMESADDMNPGRIIMGEVSVEF
ncbi:MAG: TonB-dependent receptor [Candidatus Omnitrophica bacterium]|nr:TonB-dependent receptor [Candidatus Omnitrophota bacterium]